MASVPAKTALTHKKYNKLFGDLHAVLNLYFMHLYIDAFLSYLSILSYVYSNVFYHFINFWCWNGRAQFYFIDGPH